MKETISSFETSVFTRATRRNILEHAIAVETYNLTLQYIIFTRIFPFPYLQNVQIFVFLRSVRRLLVTASVVTSSPIPVTLMKEALSSSQKTAFFIVNAVKTSNLT
jgi:hypothetical protein